MPIIYVSLPILIIDQLSKFLILKNLKPEESLPVIKNVFHINLVLNRGVAFGLFANSNPIFIWMAIICAIAIGLSLAFAGRLLLKRKSTQLSLSLILGGAAGNLIDRMRFGYVIDFLDFRIWPAFNFADSAITIGTILLLLQMLKTHKKVVGRRW